MNQTTNENQSKHKQIPYNGEPLQDGEILVPQFISRDFANLIDAQGVRTWYRAGIPYLVMFVPVPANQAIEAMKAFNADVNDFIDEQLGPNRYSRCVIRQPDGTQKPCPKEINGKYNPCSGCPNRGKLIKEDRSLISLGALNEDDFHPMNAAPSAEDCAMLAFLFDGLIDYLSQKSSYHAKIIDLFLDGKSRKDIIKLLPVQKSQGYQMIKDCQKAVEDYLKI